MPGNKVDPVGDGLLWYAYVNNNPMGFVDPTGLEAGTATKALQWVDDIIAQHNQSLASKNSNPGSFNPLIAIALVFANPETFFGKKMAERRHWDQMNAWGKGQIMMSQESPDGLNLSELETLIVSVESLDKIIQRTSEGDTFVYRGLKEDDKKEYDTMGVVLSWAVRNGTSTEDILNMIENGNLDEMLKIHAESSYNSNTPFISVTTDPEVAERNADSGFVAVIDTDRAIPNPHNSDSTGYEESELALPVLIMNQEFADEYIRP